MSIARYLSKFAALLGSDGKVPAAGLADGAVTSAKLGSGAAVSNIGYTPVNKAGDTMTGPLGFPEGTMIANRWMSRVGNTGNESYWFKICRLQLGQNGQASLRLIGCNVSFSTGVVTSGAQLFIESQNDTAAHNFRVDGWKRNLLADIRIVYTNAYDATIWVYGDAYFGGTAVLETIDGSATMYYGTGQSTSPGGYSVLANLVSL